MKLVVWANIYEGLNDDYLNDWRKALGRQLDMDYEILYSSLEGANVCLKNAVENYDAILCLDVDDIPEQALIHIAKINAGKHDVTAFGMKMVDEKNENVTGLFGRVVDVSKHNVWGFGNTVYRSDILKRLLPIDFTVAQPDWETAKKADGLGADMHFERLALIRYRQYSSSQANLVKKGEVYVWSVDQR